MSNERPEVPSERGVFYTTPPPKSKAKKGAGAGAPAYGKRGFEVQPFFFTLPDLDEEPEDREDEDDRPEDDPLERGELTDRPEEAPEDRGAL